MRVRSRRDTVVLMAAHRKKRPLVKRHHEPKAGRTAYICRGRKDEPCNARRFVAAGDPVPECPSHGKMARQSNRPYKGQGVPDA